MNEELIPEQKYEELSISVETKLEYEEMGMKLIDVESQKYENYQQKKQKCSCKCCEDNCKFCDCQCQCCVKFEECINKCCDGQCIECCVQCCLRIGCRFLLRIFIH